MCISAIFRWNIKNEDSNYDEKFWDEISKHCNSQQSCYLIVKTKKLDFYVCSSMKLDIWRAGKKVDFTAEFIEKEKFVGNIINISVKQNEEIVVYKYVCNVTS